MHSARLPNFSFVNASSCITFCKAFVESFKKPLSTKFFMSPLEGLSATLEKEAIRASQQLAYIATSNSENTAHIASTVKLSEVPFIKQKIVPSLST